MVDNLDRVNRLLDDFDKKMSVRDYIGAEIATLEMECEELESDIDAGKKARELLQLIAQSTQRNVEQHLSHIVTLALKAVSSDFPEFAVEMTIRRNQLECDLFFSQNGAKSDPMFSSGGGPKDIASFALLVAYWAMDKNRSTLILDEPFRNVSPDLQENVSEMLRMISDKLRLQIIMVSHAIDVNVCADKTFTVELDNNTSEVKEV